MTQHQPEPPFHRKFMVREGFVAFIAGMWVESIILALVGALVGGLRGGLDLALGGLGLGLAWPVAPVPPLHSPVPLHSPGLRSKALSGEADAYRGCDHSGVRGDYRAELPGNSRDGDRARDRGR